MRLPVTTLEVFNAIARAGTLNGAAAELGVTPSTVSHRLADFRRRHPDIALEISFDEGLDDLRARSFHAGFRLGGLIDDDMVAVRVAPAQPLAVLASSDYLTRHGTPGTPSDLLKHECIRYRFRTSDQLASWDFTGPDGEYRADVTGRLIVNSLDALYGLVSEGQGLGYSFARYVPRGLRGSARAAPLVPLFADVAKPAPALFACFPKEYRNLAVLRAFIDHLRDGDEQNEEQNSP